MSKDRLRTFVSPVRNDVQVAVANYHGTTNLNIRGFTLGVTSSQGFKYGDAISYVSSTADGDSFVINEHGLYNINYVDTGRSGTAPSIAVTVNVTTDLSTPPLSVSTTHILTLGGDNVGNGTSLVHLNVMAFLSQGDVVRAHTGGSAVITDGADATRFRITKIS